MTIQLGLSRNKHMSKVFTTQLPFHTVVGIYDIAIRLFRQFLPLKDPIKHINLKLSHLETNRSNILT